MDLLGTKTLKKTRIVWDHHFEEHGVYVNPWDVHLPSNGKT
jgi:hypothetical protein